MEYPEFADWMFNLERFGIKLGLENVTEFLGRIGNPHNDFRTVHVTGTNGKGSVCVFVSDILRKHGLKVGLYTSPHLVRFSERIMINGSEIPEEDVLRIGLELKEEMEAMRAENGEKQLTFFEFTTGLAFRYFSERKVDIVVAEVGMGGRLDATNVLTPEVAAITRIGLEHTNYLGTTIQDIAREKAGIIKQGALVVTGERKPDALAVIQSACTRKGATLRRIGKDFEISNVRQSLQGTAFDYKGVRELNDLRTKLLGGYQAENAAGAIAIVEDLAKRGITISDQEIRDGIASARWPGRLDVVSQKPLVIFDGSHNPDGVTTTVKVLEDLGVTPMTFVVGCMDDKDARGILRAIVPVASRIVTTRARYKRALPSEKLHAIAKEEFSGSMDSFPDSSAAFENGLARIEGKGLCAIGSLYVVGEAIQWWEHRIAKTMAPQKV